MRQKNRIGLLVGQFLVLLLCVTAISYVYTSDIYPDKQAKTLFQKTTCFLISKKLSGHGHVVDLYRADFLISYQANGARYSRWVSGNGLDTSYSRNETEQENLLTQYDVGGSYPCWYNPENPQIVILIERHDWLSTFPVMIPAVIAILSFYFFFKNIANLILSRTKKISRKK